VEAEVEFEAEVRRCGTPPLFCPQSIQFAYIGQNYADEAIRILYVIHQLGVLQKDFETRHILVHPDRPGMTWIDFERAELFSPRVTLGSLSAHRKRKLEFQEGAKFPEKSDKACAREIIRATAELTRLVGSISRANRKEGYLTWTWGRS
jgi:hypothetical protein